MISIQSAQEYTVKFFSICSSVFGIFFSSDETLEIIRPVNNTDSSVRSSNAHISGQHGPSVSLGIVNFDRLKVGSSIVSSHLKKMTMITNF